MTNETAAELIAKHGGVVAAAKATGIPRTTLQSRVEQEQVRKARPEPTIIPLAPPQAPHVTPMREVVHDAKHLVIPDTQTQPGVPLDHMRWAGLYAAKKRPTSINHLGDHWDMSSLSSYDKGKRSSEGHRYSLDIAAGNKGIELFMEPIYEEMERSLLTEEFPWDPELHFFLGNHEDRIERATNDFAAMDQTIGYKDFNLVQHGWQVHPFLEVVLIDGVAYSHFFTSGTMGRAVTSARALLTKKHMSCVMGHVQRYETAMDYTAEGLRITGLFAGCFYQHDESYLNPQGNAATWRGLHVLYGVKDGEFTHNSIDLPYLRDRFEGK